MVDNIMPHDYFRTLLPALAKSGLGAHMFYEQKANLKLHQVKSSFEMPASRSFNPGSRRFRPRSFG